MQPRRRAFDRESCTATCVAFPHVTSACRHAPNARHRPLQTTAPSPFQIRSRTAAIVPQLFHVALQLRVFVLCGLPHRNLLSPSVSHPELTVAPQTCALDHGERLCACPTAPAVDLTPSSNLVKSANTCDSALSHPAGSSTRVLAQRSGRTGPRAASQLRCHMFPWHAPDPSPNH